MLQIHDWVSVYLAHLTVLICSSDDPRFDVDPLDECRIWWMIVQQILIADWRPNLVRLENIPFGVVLVFSKFTVFSFI